MTPSREIDFKVGLPLFAVERPADPGWQLLCRQNTGFCILAYAKSGTALYHFQNGVQTVGKGTVLLIPTGETYSARSDANDPWSFYSVGFPLSPADEASRELLARLPRSFRYSDSLRMAENFAELCRVWQMKNTGYRLKCRSLILDILHTLLYDAERLRNYSAHYQRLVEIISLLQEQYTERFSAEQLSALAGLSPSHFRALFKNLTGLSCVQFQNRLKIDRAKDLLLSGSCRVSEAADAVGFTDINYFSRIFKQMTGKNPSDWLREHHT